MVVNGTWKDIGFLFLKYGDIAMRDVTVNGGFVVVAMNHKWVKDEIGRKWISGLNIAKLSRSRLRTRGSRLDMSIFVGMDIFDQKWRRQRDWLVKSTKYVNLYSRVSNDLINYGSVDELVLDSLRESDGRTASVSCDSVNTISGVILRDEVPPIMKTGVIMNDSTETCFSWY